MTALPFARVWQAAVRPETLLDLLQRTSPAFLAHIATDIRGFACWCARDAGAASAGGVPHRVLHAAERFAAGTLPPGILAAERRAAAGVAADARDVGLSRRQPSAALQLAAITTAEENPLEAARAASHYAALAAVLREGEPAGLVVRIRQASALRFFIPNPFKPEARRVYTEA